MFASIHGVYDLREELKEPIIVPGNAIVIEVADMGEVTLTTIDPLFWELLQNRELFRSIISGEHVEARFSRMLRAIHVYMPGDTLYNRTLIYEPDNIFDNRWALYRFGADTTGIPFPRNHGTIALATAELNSARFRPISDDFLRGIKSSLYTTERSEGPTLRSGLAASGRNENYSQVQFIRDCQGQYGTDPTIYIISACADMWVQGKRLTAAERDRDITLSENQRRVDLRNYECGITTLAFQGDVEGASVRLRPSVSVAAPGLRSRTGASKTARGWTEEFAPEAYANANNAVTGNTSVARAFLEQADVTGKPVLGRLNGERIALYTPDETHIPHPSGRANWPRSQAIEYAKGKELFTVGRDAKGKLIYVPFNVECKNGTCCQIINGIRSCFKSLGIGGKRTRRVLKKTKRTRRNIKSNM